MNFPLVNIAAIILGLIISTIGTIMVLVAAFRESVIWGLVVLFAPLGNLIYTCMHWAEAKAGFLASVIGGAICAAGLLTIPEIQTQLLTAYHLKAPGSAEKKAPDLTAQIQEHRQHLEALQGAFAQDGTELTKQYQALDAQRKALKPKDTAAITIFNEAAAAYQARNTARKQMQQQIETTQHELEALLDARSRNATPGASGKKVVMYTTSHCPACKAAKQYLAQKGVPYDEIDVETSRDGAQAFQKLGGHGVPLILVGDKKVEGFSAQALDALL
ncbi:MAG: glutaredoxin domain-containing protein [Chthoniobacter sp.]|uniref:glutaredoxin family protein n=1 Tax=Chthoniobacter sp. TaxID=2510640 RepID=UPI0032A5B4A6